MELTGKQLIAGVWEKSDGISFKAVNPANSSALLPDYGEASNDQIDRALKAAENSFDELRNSSNELRAQFLDTMADEVLALGDVLLERAHEETDLPMPRLTMERGRAMNQCKMFANIIREGSWVDARIDLADPERQPVPKPDVRRMLRPIGPIVVFGASNFPLAISVFGSDTVSAFGSGCPVVVKAHPAHPGTCELLGEAIRRAAEKCNLPAGIFSLIQGKSNEVGSALVKHESTTAVAFTGSLRGGRALMDLAAARPNPIPVYAEMGSVNPVFILPGALQEKGEQIANGFVQSLTLGVGQFCTNPGVVLGINQESLDSFRENLTKLTQDSAPASMLHKGISEAFSNGLERLQNTAGVSLLAQSESSVDPEKTQAACHIFEATIESYLKDASLAEENFGPSSLLLSGDNKENLEDFAEKLEGQLTATVHGTESDLQEYSKLLSILERKVGRVIINGYPTGLEVCAAMQHGGPYPAASHSYFTSVGTASIDRFVRPVSYQGYPDFALPDELKNGNPSGIWRTLDNVKTKDPVS